MINSLGFLGVLLSLLLGAPSIANANLSSLTLCKDSKSFANRLKVSVRKLEGRLSKYDKGTPPAIALQQQIDRLAKLG